MKELPPYIKGVIEGGKTKSELSSQELQEIHEMISQLSLADREFILNSLEPETPLEFTKDDTESDKNNN